MATIINDPIDQVERHEVSPFAHAAKWGAIAAIVGSVLTLISYNAGFMDVSQGFISTIIAGLLSLAVSIGIIVYGLRQYRDDVNGGVLSFKNGAMWSLGYAVVAALLTAIFLYLFYTVLAPTFVEDMQEQMAVVFENMGLADEALEEAMAAQGDMTNGSLVMRGTISSVIMSLIIGLIATLVMKNK